VVLKKDSEERKAREAAEFSAQCQDWQRTVEDLGRFTIDGNNTVSTQAELSKILKA